MKQVFLILIGLSYSMLYANEKFSSLYTNISTDCKYEKEDSILYGFKLFNTKINFLSGDINKHLSKKKYSKFFDYILFGFHSKNLIESIEQNMKFEKDSKIVYETP